jgi:hypothetical protein
MMGYEGVLKELVTTYSRVQYQEEMHRASRTASSWLYFVNRWQELCELDTDGRVSIKIVMK